MRLALALILAVPAALAGATYSGRAQTGLASWYGGGERLNRHTASGEVFRPSALTAAHRTLPLGTLVEVERAGRRVVVKINDRGPARWTGRELDLTREAARRLGYLERGEARVDWRVVTRFSQTIPGALPYRIVDNFGWIARGSVGII